MTEPVLPEPAQAGWWVWIECDSFQNDDTGRCLNCGAVLADHRLVSDYSKPGEAR